MTSFVFYTLFWYNFATMESEVMTMDTKISQNMKNISKYEKYKINIKNNRFLIL